MKKLVGVILIAFGLAVFAITSVPQLKSLVPASILALAPLKYIVIGGLILIIIGALFFMGKGGSHNVKQANEEVPIYEGEGKHKKIVGYKRE